MPFETKPVDPVLSVVVVIVSDTTFTTRNASNLGRCLDALAHQVDAPSLEILVPFLPPVDGLEKIKGRFPQVNFIPVDLPQSENTQGGSRDHHDQLRARGIFQARGEIIGLLEDHAIPDPKWCATAVATHRDNDCAAVGGAIENDIDRVLNWAVYYCDFGKYQNPVPAGESLYASDANIAYKRAALESIKPTWKDVYRETIVNWSLLERGGKIILTPDLIVYQHRTGLRLADALQERLVWGTSFAASRAQLISRSRRLLYAMLSPVLPIILVARMTMTAVKRKRHLRSYFSALPLIILLTMSWAFGELKGDLNPYPDKSAANVTHADIRV